MSDKSKDNKQDNTPSTDISQKATEEEYRIKSLYLSKSAHELKNIFITISSVLQNFKLFPNATNDEKEQFKLINSLCNFGLNLILDINTAHVLDYTKVNKNNNQKTQGNSENNEEFNLIEILDFCLKIFQARQKFDNKNPQVSIISDFRIPSDTKIKSINDIRLKQVIINLLSNSYKFTKKGEIKLSCLFTSKNKIRIRIADTGTGISPEEMERLFQPFQVVESNQKYNYYGSGLGLCIVKDILEAFHTQIRYKSTIGKGTEFWFDLDNFVERNTEIIDQKIFITESLLKMMSEINSGLKDNQMDGQTFDEIEEENFINGKDQDSDSSDYESIDKKEKPKNKYINPKEKVFYSKTTNQLSINKKHTSNLRDMKHVANVNGSFSTFKVMRSLSQTQCTQCIQNSIFFKKPSKKYNIFICDDERQTAISTQNLLNRYFKKKSNPESFPDIFIVPDGIQCLFQTYQFYLQDNSVNLILMDQNMPFLSGSVICSLIKSIRELDKTAIYLITSEDYRDNLCKEANGIYSKPLKFSDIENILHQQFFD